jgi:hypothetical protein
MKTLPYLFVISALLAGCGEAGRNQGLINEEVASEMSARDIRRVSEAELIERAFETGRMIADSAQKALQTRLIAAIQTGGPAYAVDFCHTAALPIMDSLSSVYNAEIRRVSNRYRNPQDAPNDSESAILEAYEYNAEEGLSLEDNIQKIGTDYFLYTKPILLGSPLCLNCHGQENTQISSETMDVLRLRYPSDKATNHELNDLRGMWSIRISRKSMVLK